MLHLKKKQTKKTPGDIIILHLWSNILDDMIYSSWDIECGSLGKMKKLLEISYVTCALKTTIICSMVPEIWSETERIFCHFGPFFALLHPPPLKIKIFVYQNSLSYDYCFLKYRVQQTIFCHFGLLLPPNSPKNQN